MAFTPQDTIDLARITINDAAKARVTDADGLKYVNGGLNALALLRPDLFIVVLPVATVPNVANQDIAVADVRALNLYDIYQVAGGAGVAECDLETLRRFSPNWMTATAGTPVNWMRHPQDPKQGSGTRYFLSPPPKAGVQMVSQYVQAPAALALADPVPVPDPFKEPLAHYVIFRAESMDDEFVVTGRATQSMQLFMQANGLSQASKVVMNEGRAT